MEMLRTLRAELNNRVGSMPIVGPLLREYARRFPEGSVIIIGSGFAAGLRWKRHHRYVNGYWIGNYEYPIQRAIARLLAPGDVLYDLGANAGFFSLLAGKLVGPTGQVYAFEPLDKRPKLPIDLHGLDKGESVVATLRARGYSFFKLDGSPAVTPEREPHILAEPSR